VCLCRDQVLTLSFSQKKVFFFFFGWRWIINHLVSWHDIFLMIWIQTRIFWSWKWGIKPTAENIRGFRTQMFWRVWSEKRQKTSDKTEGWRTDSLLLWATHYSLTQSVSLPDFNREKFVSRQKKGFLTGLDIRELVFLWRSQLGTRAWILIREFREECHVLGERKEPNYFLVSPGRGSC
jgi:hypothetical protein